MPDKPRSNMPYLLPDYLLHTCTLCPILYRDISLGIALERLKGHVQVQCSVSRVGIVHACNEFFIWTCLWSVCKTTLTIPLIFLAQRFLESSIPIFGVWDDHDYNMNDGGRVCVLCLGH